MTTAETTSGDEIIFIINGKTLTILGVFHRDKKDYRYVMGFRFGDQRRQLQNGIGEGLAEETAERKPNPKKRDEQRPSQMRKITQEVRPILTRVVKVGFYNNFS
ncbi:hypothetical protein M0R45_025406 [Rubus argutus]|uniref:Uncharacterized protein n=1 Tax=Rubus argutus TaxID=59490 RepID=A0AAW1WY52_RUBAR